MIDQRRTLTIAGFLALMFAGLIAVGFVACSMAHAQPAAARPSCKPHDAYMEMLASKYDEHVVAFGIVTADGEPNGKPAALMEMTRSDSGSWTLVLTDATTGCSGPLLSGGRFRLKAAERGA
jgi:hypothetical protein